MNCKGAIHWQHLFDAMHCLPSGMGPYGASTCRYRGSLHDMVMGSTRPVVEVMQDLPMWLLLISAVKLGMAVSRSAKMVCVGVLMFRCVGLCMAEPTQPSWVMCVAWYLTVRMMLLKQLLLLR